MQKQADFLESFARAMLINIFQEYPTWNAQRIASCQELSVPRDRHPLFWGSYDWYSCVLAHWALVTCASLISAQVHVEIGDDMLRSLNQGDAAAEANASYSQHDVEFFERPYGIAWYCELEAALHRLQARTAT